LPEQLRAELGGGERAAQPSDEIQQPPDSLVQLCLLARARVGRPPWLEHGSALTCLGGKGREAHQRRARGPFRRGDDGPVPQEPEEVEGASADARKPKLKRQLAEPECPGDFGQRLSGAKPRKRRKDYLTASHLAGKGVARKYALPAFAPHATRERDKAMGELRKGVQLPANATARQDGACCAAPRAAAGGKLLVYLVFIGEERLVVATVNGEYV
jgi:hypothetical protein